MIAGHVVVATRDGIRVLIATAFTFFTDALNRGYTDVIVNNVIVSRRGEGLCDEEGATVVIFFVPTPFEIILVTIDVFLSSKNTPVSSILGNTTPSV